MNPLESFIATVCELGRHRDTWSHLTSSSVTDLSQTLDDLSVLGSCLPVSGLRTRFARRVVLPVMRAQKAIEECEESYVMAGAKSAIEILQECTDEALRRRCVEYIKGEYHVEDDSKSA